MQTSAGDYSRTEPRYSGLRPANGIRLICSRYLFVAGGHPPLSTYLATGRSMEWNFPLLVDCDSYQKDFITDCRRIWKNYRENLVWQPTTSAFLCLKVKLPHAYLKVDVYLIDSGPQLSWLQFILFLDLVVLCNTFNQTYMEYEELQGTAADCMSLHLHSGSCAKQCRAQIIAFTQ